MPRKSWSDEADDAFEEYQKWKKEEAIQEKNEQAPLLSAKDTKKDAIADEAVKGTSAATSKTTYAAQAAKEAPPPEPEVLNPLRVRQLRLAKERLEKLGAAEIHRRSLIAAKAFAIDEKKRAISNYQDGLLPCKPGSRLEQYTTFAPATYFCKNLWSAENGRHIKDIEKALNVHIQSVFEPNVEFRLWVEPANWKAFEKEPEKGRAILARAEKFMEFWVWEFASRAYATDKTPLSTCLAWFLTGEKHPRYQKFLEDSKLNPKPELITQTEKYFNARATLDARAKEAWNSVPGKIAAEDRARSSTNRGSKPDNASQLAFRSTFRTREYNEKDGTSKVVSKKTEFIDARGKTHSSELAAANANTKPEYGQRTPIKPSKMAFGVLEIKPDGSEIVTSAKDSRGEVHISKEAAQKANKKYTENPKEDSDSHASILDNMGRLAVSDQKEGTNKDTSGQI